jgi:hypothetical protein
MTIRNLDNLKIDNFFSTYSIEPPVNYTLKSNERQWVLFVVIVKILVIIG